MEGQGSDVVYHIMGGEIVFYGPFCVVAFLGQAQVEVVLSVVQYLEINIRCEIVWKKILLKEVKKSTKHFRYLHSSEHIIHRNFQIIHIFD